MEEKKITSASTGPHNQEAQPISFIFHLITITITGLVIFTLIRLTVTQPVPTEDLFLIKSLTPEILNENGNSPTSVRTGLFIYKFRDFDVLNNNFAFEGVIWFEFDPALVSLDTVSNFSFEKGEILHISEPKSRLVGKLLRVFYEIVVKFKTELDYKLFPLDDHMIELVFLNKKVSPQELIFNIDNQSFTVDEKTNSYGWIHVSQQVISGYIEETIDTRELYSNIEHPALQFSILYRRSGLKYALILLMPMLVFIIVMLTAFSYDPNKYFSSVMVANGASLSGLVGFRFVIENMSPKVGYFMLSDYFFLVFLSLAALLFLIGIFSLNVSMRTKKILIITVHLLLMASFAIIVSYVLSFTYHGAEFF